MQKAALALAAASLLLAATGCLPSFIPLAKKGEAKPEGLVGTWAPQNDGALSVYKVSAPDEEGVYEIEQSTPSEKNAPKFFYKMAIAKIGDELYASVAMDLGRSLENSVKWSKEIGLYAAPMFWTFKLKLSGDDLKLLSWDDKAAKPPQGEFDDEPSPISVDRKALREWVAKDGAKAFVENPSFFYKRVPSASK